MENLNFDNDAIIDPKDEAIENLRQQLAEANRRDAFKADQLDQLGDAIMALIGDKVEALAESKADDAVDGAFRDFNNDFNIYDHQSEIEDMIKIACHRSRRRRQPRSRRIHRSRSFSRGNRHDRRISPAQANNAPRWYII
jgi:hypothetical protein